MAKLRGMNERIQKLREISVNTPVHIDLERAKIETDFYKENDGKYSIPVMRAMKPSKMVPMPCFFSLLVNIYRTMPMTPSRGARVVGLKI